jgi:hypothetical protein
VRGDHVDLLRGEHAGRGERNAEHRLEQRHQARLDRGDALERRSGVVVAVGERADRLEERARLLGQAVGRLAPRKALEQRRELEQRVVAEPRHRGVGGDAVGVQSEAEDALLGAAEAVEAAAAVLDDAAAALVDEIVAAHLVGVVGSDPLGAVGAAGLLVDERDEDQRAARRTPAPARERARRGSLRGRLGLHVERAAPPHEAVVHVTRPGVARPLRRRREHGV